MRDPGDAGLLNNRFVGLVRAWRRLRPLADAINRDAWRLLQDAEAIVYTPLNMTVYGVARKLDVPSFMIYYLPFDPSSEMAPLFAGVSRRRSPLFNRLASEIGYRVMWRVFAGGARRLRRELALPPPSLLRSIAGTRPAWRAGPLRIQPQRPATTGGLAP